MSEEKTQIRLFEEQKVRTVWNAEEEEWYFSVVDVCKVLAESASKDPGAYWRKLKQRLKAEGSEVVTNCHGLKLPASDGKFYKTDCLDTEGIFRLIQSIPSPKSGWTKYRIRSWESTGLWQNTRHWDILIIGLISALNQ